MNPSQSARASLGVGQIIRESFRVLARHWLKVLVLAVPLTILGLVVAGYLITVLVGSLITTEFQSPSHFLYLQTVIWGSFTLGALFQLAVFSVIFAVFAQIAHHAQLARKVPFVTYLRPAAKAFLPIFCLGVVILFLVSAASVFLLLPGLWVMAVFSVTAPAIVIEGAGFAAMGRSMRLTKGYRWPILGCLTILGLSIFLLLLVPVALQNLFLTQNSGFTALVGMVLVLSLYGVGFSLFAIAAGLIYTRLREIKEGVGVDNLAEVFD